MYPLSAARAAEDAGTSPEDTAAASVTPPPVVAVDGDIVTLHYDCKDSEGGVRPPSAPCVVSLQGRKCA